MKKNVVRILALVLVGLMCLSLLPAISHADWCSHDSLTTVTVEPVCGEDGYTAAVCQICGEMFGTEIIPHTEEHDFSACVMADDYLISLGDCLTPTLYYKSCSKCGQIAEFAYQSAMMQMQQDLWDQYNRELAYYGAAVTDWEARIRQATEEIQNQYTFKVGGEGHRFYEVERQPATCLEDGWEAYRVCEECGAVEGYQAIPAKGHRFGDYTVTREPTCTEAGLRQRVCEVCGEVEEETVPALGHKGPFTTVKAPTCTEPGSEKRICTVCQAEEIREIPALGHKGPFTVTKEATCTEDGVQERDCTVCGAHETAVIPAAHKYGEDNHCVFCGVENPNRPAVSDTETFGSKNENSEDNEEEVELVAAGAAGVNDTETFNASEIKVELSITGEGNRYEGVVLAGQTLVPQFNPALPEGFKVYWIPKRANNTDEQTIEMIREDTYTVPESYIDGTIVCVVIDENGNKEAGRSDTLRIRKEVSLDVTTRGQGEFRYSFTRLGQEGADTISKLPPVFLTGDKVTFYVRPDLNTHIFRRIATIRGNTYTAQNTVYDADTKTNSYTFTVTTSSATSYLLETDIPSLYNEAKPTLGDDSDLYISREAENKLEALRKDLAGSNRTVEKGIIRYVTPIWASDALAMSKSAIETATAENLIQPFVLAYPNGIDHTKDLVQAYHYNVKSGEWEQIGKASYELLPDGVQIKGYTDFSPFAVIGIRQVTLSFVANNGSNESKNETVDMGTTFTAPACSFAASADKAFKNWLGSDGETYEVGATVPKTGTLSGDFTLTAQWTEGHTITFDKNNNNATGSMDALFVPEGEEIALTKNSFELKNHAFAGWSTTAEGEKSYDDEARITPTENLDLFAKWTRTHSTVTFDPHGGTGAMSSQTGALGGKLTLAQNSFQNDDKLFAGWATEEGGAVVYTDGQTISVPNSDQTFYAVWDYKVTVRYSPESDKASGTGTMADQTVPGGRKFTLTRNSFKAPNMFVFNGWNTVKDGSGTAYADGQEIAEGLTEDTTLYAQWKRTAYTVTYVGNGGTGSMNTQTIPLKGAVGISQNGFTAPYGKAFLGWSEDPDAVDEDPAYNPGQKLEAGTLETRDQDLTLYAVWGEIVTVRFYPTDGQQTGTGTMADQQLIRGRTDSLNTNRFTAPADYKFAGWNTQPDGSGTPYADGKTFTKDELNALPSILNLYAQWERAVYNVSFDKNREDATGTMAVQKMDADRESALNAVAFKAPTDYAFKYWTKTAADPYPDMTADEVTTDDVYKDRAKLTPTNDMLLYAQWERSVYNVSFDKNNADATGTMSSQKVARNAETSLNAVSFKAPANFAFKYWTETADDPYPDQSADVVTATDIYRDRAAINTAEKRLSGDVTLYAQWERVSYSVIYNANGGTGTTASQTIPKDGGVEAAANRFTAPAGRIFIGWSKTPGQENAVDYKVGDAIRWEDLNREPYTDLTLYAVWKDKVTITFNHDSDSGSGTGTMAAQEAPKGEKVTLNANKFTAPTGMAFGGWNTKADGTGTAYADSAEITPTENITLYAQWLEDACTVTFDKNNDAVEGEAYTQSILKNTATALKENQFIAPKGLAFNGWNTKRDGTGTAFKDKANVKVSKDITLYAQWINAATVTFNKNADDATGTMTAQVVETGVDTPLTANAFKRINYSFDGWTTNPDGTGDKYADQGSINTLTDVTLYAVWKQIAYAITYDANGGGGSQMPQQNVSVGSTATIRDCAYNPKPGEVFAYWKEDRVYSMTQAGESGSEHSDIYYPGEKIIPTRDMDLKAIWVDELVISYYPGEGSGTYNTGEVPKGVETSVKTASEAQFTPPANATFAYWQDGAGNRYYEGKQYVFDKDTSLTAVWAPAVTITYNKNASDASGSMASQSVPSGVEVTLHENRFSRNEYIFKYWTKTKSDPYPNKDPKDVTTNDVYKDGTNITIAQDTALYAQWYKTAISANAVLITGEVTGLDDFAVWGETLTAVVNDPVLKSGFTYTWQVDGNPVKSGSDNTYLVSKEDYGKPIVCVVSHPQATNEVESNTKIVGTYAEDDDLIIINNGSDAYPYSKYAYVYGVVPGTTFYKDGKEYLVPESAADGFMEIGIPGTYTFGYATYYIENWFTVGYEVDTTGSSGTVSMKNGSTTLTSTTRTADIQHFVNTIWLVRDGSATDLNITMTPASSTYVHWSLNGGNYSSSGAAVSRRLGTINQPMLFSVVFNKSSTSPKTGDMSNLGLWSALCFTSFVGTAVVLGKARKGKKTRA